jgi:hypothetical protein
MRSEAGDSIHMPALYSLESRNDDDKERRMKILRASEKHQEFWKKQV